jgi:glutathione S-transferase
MILYGIHYSPWTARARWALDHHGIDYRYREHSPYLGERALRKRGQRAGLSGRITVPLLLGDGVALGDSWQIMAHADSIGSGASLGTGDPEIAAWGPDLEPAFAAARRRVTRRVMADKAALTEAAQGTVPNWMAGAARPIARLGTRFIAKKYGFDPDATEDDSAFCAGLDRIRAQLNGEAYLYDGFSAADIVAACLIAAVRPHASHRLGPANFAAWEAAHLVEPYADLLQWRDTMFATHRPQRRRR